MNSTLMHTTPATGLSCYVAAERSAFIAPFAAVQGTGLPIAGTSLLLAAAAGTSAEAVVVDVRNTDLPGPTPRGAPV